MDAAYQQAETYLQAKQAELRAQGFEVRIILRGVEPNKGISKVIAAQKADLIVMATHGCSGFARWASGSVADEVVRHSQCPVLLVHQIEEDRRPDGGKRVTNLRYQRRPIPILWLAFSPGYAKFIAFIRRLWPAGRVTL
jgi:hypothetical protein